MTKKNQTFEEALGQLEELTGKLEGDELTLESALAYFEQGIGLVRFCGEQLKKADGRLKELLKGEDGEFIEKVIGASLGMVLGEEDFDE